MIPVNENFRYILRDEAAIEDFDDGSLIFLTRQKKIIEINHLTRRVLCLLNGKRSLRQLIKKISRDHKIQGKKVQNDIQELVADLEEKGVIGPLLKMRKRRKKMDKKSSLLANPGISLREEEDGALLFNADTNALLVINSIGLVIWQFIKVHPRTKADIIGHLKQTCDGVPLDQVEADVDKFVAELYGKGFIGEVVDEKKS
jgi:hypothetical protein